MKAIIQHGYGSTDVLAFEEVETPEPGDDEVLVRVLAAGVNTGDWHLLRGVPYLVRLMFGLRRPRNGVPGMDIAGRVEAVGGKVEGLRPGDEVFGWCDGAFAEYASAPASNLLPKPAGLGFEEAAAIGDSALTALQAVRDKGRVDPGQRVLVIGASGGVGSFVVQIARAFGAHVTGVCSTQSMDVVREIGADEVIDYTREDFADGERRYDVIFDLVGNRSLADCRRALTPRGTYVVIGVHDVGRWFGMSRQAKALVSSLFLRQRMRILIAKHTREDLEVIKSMAEEGKIVPVIDRRYRLEQVPDALRHQGEGHGTGKSVVVV